MTAESEANKALEALERLKLRALVLSTGRQERERLENMTEDETTLIRTALTRLSELEPIWRPIETAPKTGERILLAAPWLREGDPPTQVAYGHWYKLGPYWAYDGYSFGNPKHQPTHWMPLPSPPTALRR